MKTDWKQVKGFWVSVDERFPPCKGEYYVITTHLNEYNMRYDPDKSMPHWDLKHLDDWVVQWLDTVTDPATGKFEKTSPI